MKKATPKITGNVLILPILSSRNKDTGKYQLSTDGNVNSMLHLLSINSSEIKSVEFVFPDLALVDQDSIKDFRHTLSSFSKFQRINFYLHFDNLLWYNGYHQSDTLKTRIYVNELLDNNQSGLSFCENSSHGKTIDTIVTEFPFGFYPGEFRDDTKIIYNINWSVCSDDLDMKQRHNIELMRSYFEERRIASLSNKLKNKNHEFYVYSDVQYEYLSRDLIELLGKDSVESKDCQVYRKEKIYDVDLINYIADESVKSISDEDRQFVDFLLEEQKSRKYNSIVFLAFRLNDVRYELEKLLTHYSDDSENLFILTNPTKTPISKEVAKLLTTLNLNYLDLSRVENIDQRKMYFYFLKNFKPYDKIPHFEPDMHMSTIEQFVLCQNSLALHNKQLTRESVKSYIHM